MKQLQNNFTTPEQSKRLLELGVPSDSADCYLTRFGIDEDWEVKVLNNVKYSELSISNQEYCLPCWSACRLMEIFDICCILKDGTEWMNTQSVPVSYVAYLIDCSVCAIKHKQLDFSKLED